MGWPQRVLVFETTASALRGAVATRGWDGILQISAVASSSLVPPQEAVGAVLEQLAEAQSQRLPSQAILISPVAAAQLLEIPVDPKNKKLLPQVQEMVRWDLEELFVHQADLWSIGALMQARGYASADQRQTLDAQSDANRSGGAALNRYRDAFARDQVDECLMLQDQFVAMDGELRTGLSPQKREAEDGSFLWYCGGANESLVAPWSHAMAHFSIHCAWVYPSLGFGFGLLPFDGVAKPEKKSRYATEPDAVDGCLLVEVQSEQFALFVGVDGRLERMQSFPFRGGEFRMEQVADEVAKWNRPDLHTLYIDASEEHELELRKIFEQEGLAPVVALATLAEFKSVPLRMEAVARHALKASPASRLVRIQAQAPKPPLWKSKTFMPWAIMGALVVGVIACETTLQVRKQHAKKALFDAEINYEVRLRMKSDAAKTQSEVNALQKQLDEKDAELHEMIRQRQVLETIIHYRQKLVPGVLRAVAQSIPEGVVLSEFREQSDRSGFLLLGWALRSAEAERFGSQLNHVLTEWNYKVADVKMSRSKGQQGLDGYSVQIKVIQTEELDDDQ